MTLVDERYHEEILGTLVDRGIDVHHYSLIASPEVIRRRLNGRVGYAVGRYLGFEETWAMQQVDRCVAALSRPRFATHVDNDRRSVDEVVEEIAEDAGLPLVRPRLDPLRHQVHRLTVAMRHRRR